MKRVCIVYNTSRYLVRFRRRMLERLQEGGAEVHALAPEDEHTPALRALGVHWHDWPLSRHGTNALSEARSAASAYRTIRRIAPDALLAVTVKAVLYAGAAAALAGVPRRVALVAGLGNLVQGEGALASLVRPVYQGVLRRYHGVMVQNTDDEAAVRRLLGPRAASTEILRLPGSGVDLDEFSPPASRSTGRPVVIMVTRLVWAKGLREFCAAASQLRDLADFVLVGALDSNPDSPSAGEIKALAAASGVELKLDVHDVAAELRRAHLFAYPSYYPEGIPRSVIEALATGLPVITTDSPGCREAIEEGKQGFLVAPRNPDALCRKLRELLSDPAAIYRFGASARARAEAVYDERQVGARMADFVTGT